jgi:CheY-like chemotaxis protein
MYRELKIDPQLKHIPVIMLTGVGEKSFTHYLKMLKIQVTEPLAEPEGYMEKPLDQERLLDLAETLLT